MAKDEQYVIDLCDEVLERVASRQHRFGFLRGDPNAAGNAMTLPVDAYYAELALVIEYRERQHHEPVAFFDRRMTLSGMPRGEQRRLYDQRRREVLPVHGIELVEMNFEEFPHDRAKRLLRKREEDLRVVREKLRRWLTQ